MRNNNNKFTVSLHGASRNHNYGDVLLMAIFKDWIEDSGGRVIMDMANKYYGKYLNVDHSIPIKEAVKTADFVVYGGGGYFGEPRRPTLRWRAKFVLHHMLPAIYARLKKKPYGFFGVGFGPLDNWLVRKIGMFALNGAEIVSVRDEESKKYLLEYGFKKKIHVVPDAALSIADRKSIFYINDQEDERSKKRIALHIPLDKGRDFDTLKKHLLRFLKEIKGNCDYEYCFLVDHGLGENCRQFEFYNSIRNEFDSLMQIKEYSTPEDTLDFINSSDVILTTKLHVAITSYALGKKVIGISKHPKTKRFFKQVGMESNHFDLYDLLDEVQRQKIIGRIQSDNQVLVKDEIVKKALYNKDLIKALVN